jgi:DNA-binding transcriptional regulator YiaG
MTKDEIREARLTLGLSADKFGRAIGLGAHGGRTVRRWEKGDQRISERTAAAVRLLLENHAAALRMASRS